MTKRKRDEDSSWYDDAQLNYLLEHYAGSENVEVLAAIDSNEALQAQLTGVEATEKQYTLPLNVNALTKELGQDINHWVGLYITHNGIDAPSGKKRVIVDYVDPMGNSISPALKHSIEEYLSSLQLSAEIKEPLLGKPIQYAKQISEVKLQGNTDDCGPMLVYVMACLSRSLGDDLPKFADEVTSRSFGSFLREGFDREDNFNVIYGAAMKNHNTGSSGVTLTDGADDAMSLDEPITSGEQEEKTEELAVNFGSSIPLTPDGLKSTLHGVVYQRALLTLAAIRAQAKSLKFYLVSEAEEFEKFDDLVIDYGNKIIYLQAKHGSSEEASFSKTDFCSGNYNNPGGLAKYFDSWFRLKSSKYSEGKTTQYIFFTNKDVNQDVKGFLEAATVEEDEFLFEGLATNTYGMGKSAAVRREFIDAIAANSEEVRKTLKDINLDKIDLDILTEEVVQVKTYLSKRSKETKGKAQIKEHANLNKKACALIKLAKEDETFAEKLLGKSPAILKWIKDTEININISNPLGVLFPTMLSDINDFLDEFIIKIEQPNRHNLAKIILKELERDIADIGTRELNNAINDYMWEWLADCSNCLLKSEDFGNFVKLVHSDLHRFYLLDSTRIFIEECKSSIVAVKHLSLLDGAKEFLTKGAQHIAIVKDGGGGVTQQLYSVVETIDDLKDDEWSFLQIDSRNIKRLPEVLIGKSSKFYIIDCRLEQINDDQLAILRDICQVTRKNSKKLILLVTPEQDDLLGQLAGETEDDRGDFTEFESHPLTDEQIRDIGVAHADKHISLAGKDYSVREIVDRKIGSVYELMRDVKYLTQIIECAREGGQSVESEMPYGVYIPNQMSKGEPCYDSSIFTRKIASCYIVEDIGYRELKSVLETLFAEQQRRGKFSTSKEFTEESEFVLLQDSSDLSSYGNRVIILTKQSSEEILGERTYLLLKSLGSNRFQITGSSSNLHLPFTNDLEFPQEVEQENLLVTMCSGEQLSVVMSPAGYGKTSFCQNILERHRSPDSEFSSIWMVKIPLTKLQFDGKRHPILSPFLRLDYEWQKEAWKIDEQIPGRIFIILDGFDEVKGADTVRLINGWISTLPISTSLLVTTREYAANKLKLPDERNSTFYKLAEYTEEQRIEYITRYIEAILSATERNDEFDDFAQKVSEKIQSKIAEHPRGVLGIPLESYIFCELYKPYILAHVKKNGYALTANALDALEEVDVSNLAKLYQEFILVKSKIFLEKHLGINPDSIINKGILLNLMGSYNQIIEIYALKQAFGLSDNEIAQYVDSINFSRYALKAIEDTGLLTVSEDSTALGFNHETYQEFYAALAIIRGILSDRGELHELVNPLVREHRYDPKFHFIFSMASQFSVASGPMVPGYSADKHLLFFWSLLGGDGDIIGAAAVSLFENCTSEFTSDEREMLLDRLSATNWIKFLQAAFNGYEGGARNEQKSDDRERLPISSQEIKEDDDSVDYGGEIDTSKDVVATIFRGFRKRGELTKEAVSALEYATDKHLEKHDFWALDGGIEAIGYTGQFFSKRLADYLISRSIVWVNNKCLALEALISIYKDLNDGIAEHTEAQKNCFFVIKNLFSKSVGANNERAFVDLLYLVDVKFLEYLKEELLHLPPEDISQDTAKADLAIPNWISKVASKVTFKKVFEATQCILLAAEKLKYAVLIDESKQQIILLKEMQIEFEFPEDERGKIFANLMLELLKNNFNSSEVTDCFKAVQPYKMNQQKIEKYFYSQLQDDKLFDQYFDCVVGNEYGANDLLHLYQKLFKYGAITRHSVEKYTAELSTDKATNKYDYWSMNVGIEIAGYTGVYFNEQIAGYLKLRNKHWSDNQKNKEAIQKSLKRIYKTLASLDIDKSQDEYIGAVKAYNCCISSDNFSGLERIELNTFASESYLSMDIDSSPTELQTQVLGDSHSGSCVMEE